MKSISYILDALGRRIELRKAENLDAHLSRHVVVIESDDWGSIRMPSPKVLEELKSKGYRYADFIGYDLYDTLASNTDLEMLIEALSSVKDSEGHCAKLTMNCVVANPDFEKIRQSDFSEYHYEVFTETLKRYPHHDRSFSLWKEGMNAGVLHPQFHGREHLNAQMWLQLLQKGCKPVLDTFDKKIFSIVDFKDFENAIHLHIPIWQWWHEYRIAECKYYKDKDDLMPYRACLVSFIKSHILHILKLK